MTATKGTNTMSFEYDSEGLRISKTVNGVTTYYVYDGDLLAAEYTDTKAIVYIYDAYGSPIGFKYRANTYAQDAWDIYWYGKNLQGDIVAIYSSNGIKLINYTYNAWGTTTKTYSNGGASTTAVYNNLTYRGYYYDADLGMYYLQSRYYDANVCRFINADSYVSTGQGLHGYNMFAYCGNNPVTRYDPNGNSWLIVGIVVACTIVGGMMGAFSAATTGGDVVESAIESAATAAVSATCGLLIGNSALAVPIAAGLGTMIDIATQAITQYSEKKEVNLSKIDYCRALDVGLQTGITTAVPSFKNAKIDYVDAVGTAIAWLEVSVFVAVADVIGTNVICGFKYP